MLQEMRKFAKSKFASILLGVLALSFVSWGAGDWLVNRTNTAVATVGGTKIEQTIFQRDYSNTLSRLGQERGKAISPDEARKENLPNRLLQDSIDRTVLDNIVRQLNLTAGDALVSASIQAIPAFAGPTGIFDRPTFLQRISSLNYSEKGFIELVRQDMARNQLVHAVEGGYEIPPAYALALFAYYTEVRAADYIVVGAKALGPIAPPTDAVLEAYVKAHADKFSTPEYRDVTYAWITPDDVMGEVKVTDEQIKQAYDANLEKFITPEKRELQQLNYANEAAAKAAYAKLKAGQTVEQAAAALGEKPEDINLGELVEEDMEPAIGAEQAKAVFKLPQGGMTEPLKTTSGGWAIVRVSKLTPGTTKTLDEAKDELHKTIAQELAQSKIVDIANAYTDASSGGLNLREAAEKAGMHVAHITAMDANGLAPDGSKTSAPDDPEFRKLVFEAEVGEEGDPRPLKTGTYVIGVNGLVPPKLKPLSEIRTAAVEAWTAEQRAILLRKKAEELAAMANKDKSLDKAAKSIHAKLEVSPGLNRRTSDETFSPELIAALFDAMPGEAVFGPKGASGDYVIARVTGILHPPLPTSDPGYKQGLQIASRGIAAGITETLIAAQRTEQGVKIDEKLLNGVVGEGS